MIHRYFQSPRPTRADSLRRLRRLHNALADAEDITEYNHILAMIRQLNELFLLELVRKAA
jgi:hypothetical protein